VLRLDRNLLGAPFELALPPRDRKLGHLAALEPDTIVSATIGCIQHLRSGTPIAVMPSATGGGGG
jgi:Fe-S oxidoreductase